MINVWKKVADRHPDWSLHIWGAGDMRAALEQHIKSMGMTGHVFLKGYSSTVTDEMAKASLFLSTSVSEGFSLATIEAMSVGLPAVAYNCPGGLRYVLEDGETGFVVPMNDEETFVEKVCTLIENEELRKVMGQAALKEAARYKIDAIVQKWMTLFYELLIEKRNQK